jgi:hypothetical protein
MGTRGVRSPVSSMIAVGPSSMSVPSGIRSRSSPAVVMFSPSYAGADLEASSKERGKELGRDQVNLSEIG